MARCIVTGATGFLGMALCRELIAQGDEVYAILRPDSPRQGRLKALQEASGAKALGKERSAKGCLRIYAMRLGDIEGFSLAHRIRADIFFHLAWHGSSGQERDNFDIQQANLGYVADAVRAASACGCRKFVGAGSQAEYGVVRKKAKEEETVPHPFMMYGAAKLAAGQMGCVLAEQLGIRFVWPRIYSVYGVGENPGTLVNYMMEALQRKEVPRLSPCENRWNFLYIADCAKILAALGKSVDAEGIYHVASDDTRPLKAFMEEMRDILSPGATLHFGARPADPERTFWLDPDISRMESVIRLAYTPFGEGVRRRREESG